MNENTKNYHARLQAVEESFDPPLKFLRTKYNNQHKENWVSWWFLRGIKNYTRIFKQSTKFKDKVIVGISYILPIVGWGGSQFFQEKNIVIISIAVSLLISYILNLFQVFTELCNIKSPNFHINAYKVLRKQEYYWFETAFFSNDGDFYFKSLREYIFSQMGHEPHLVETKKTIETMFQNSLTKDNRLENDNQKLREMLHELESTTRFQEENYKNAIKEEKDAFDKYQTASFIIHELLLNLNIIISRLIAGRLSYSDIAILCGFTLYKKNSKNEFVLITDIDTSGKSSVTINNTNTIYKELGWHLFEEDSKQIIGPYAYRNYQVISLVIDSDTTNGLTDETYIYTLYFSDSEGDKKKLTFLEGNDIIALEEIYELFYNLVLLMESNIVSKVEREINDGESNKSDKDEKPE